VRLPRLPDSVTRFWSKPLSFWTECPRCGTVLYAQTTKRGFGPAGKLTKADIWDPRTSRLHCQECKLTCVVGLILWPVAPGLGHSRTAPQDQVPGERENAQLRAMGGEGAGWWMPREGLEAGGAGGGRVNAGGIKAHRPEHSNITAKCTCRHVEAKGSDFWDVDPECPLHREPDPSEQVNTDKWPR
jgi:hypothetical protein